ncbi:MAG: FtsW/RodA/SpoVE family cell cycle protein, partial [Candidatus Omnitrophota bacterium]
MQRDLAKIIWICLVLIIGLSLLALYSATYQNVRVSNKIFYDQLFSVLAGFLIMFFLGRVDYRRFYDIAYIFYILNILLLVMVLASGRHALGARRWFEIGGLSFQPSEVTKLAMILMLGRYFSENKISSNLFSAGGIQRLVRNFGLPLILTGIPMLLIFKQPDLGTAILIFGIFYVMLFASGL